MYAIRELHLHGSQRSDRYMCIRFSILLCSRGSRRLYKGQLILPELLLVLSSPLQRHERLVFFS
jgi:hypothetical protein